MIIRRSNGLGVRVSADGRTDGQTDGRYQVHYLPRFAVDNNIQYHSLLRLNSIKQQVVSGYNYGLGLGLVAAFGITHCVF